jgi:hypothetical protein
MWCVDGFDRECSFLVKKEEGPKRLYAMLTTFFIFGQDFYFTHNHI